MVSAPFRTYTNKYLSVSSYPPHVCLTMIVVAKRARARETPTGPAADGLGGEPFWIGAGSIAARRDFCRYPAAAPRRARSEKDAWVPEVRGERRTPAFRSHRKDSRSTDAGAAAARAKSNA